MNPENKKVDNLPVNLKKIVILLEYFINFYIFAYAKESGPVAQLDRASDYGSEGWEFESSQVHSKLQLSLKIIFWGFYFLLIDLIEFNTN